MKGATMSKQSEKERGFEREFHSKRRKFSP